MQRNRRFNRMVFVYVMIILALLVCFFALFRLQIIEGASYETRSEMRVLRTVPVKAPRGKILDRYGRALVSNENGYSVQLHSVKDENKLNESVCRLILLFLEQGQDYIDNFPMSFEEPFTFTFSAGNDDELAEKKKRFFESVDITPCDEKTVLSKLCERYEITPSAYDEELIRRIVGIRYEMERRSFNASTPYTFATDVGLGIVTSIKEQTDRYGGVNIVVEPIRRYEKGDIAVHLIGNTGIIFEDEYAVLKDKGYGMNDVIGKSGLEKTFESYLRGLDGYDNVEQNINGRLKTVVESKKPTPGNNLVTTLDSRLQERAERALEETILALKEGSAPDCSAGSVVVTDVNSGDILAVASYPDYSLNTYQTDYNQLIADSENPLFNRAFLGTYEPGSTFKMLTAIAALESGNVAPYETIYDQGKYKFYRDYQPVCAIYPGSHGWVDVAHALEVSCNYFFYEVGRKTGIETICDFAEKFGFGKSTGVELGDATGVLAGPESAAERGWTWNPGDTLQASIGQSYNLFTPLQLANYVSAIANGGTLYQLRLVKEVRNYSNGDIVDVFAPKVLENIDVKAESLKVVREGMRLVAQTGTASATFADFPIAVAAKTGTAENGSGSNNGIFVAYAPADNPQIAVSVVVEHGLHGSSIAPVAHAVFEEYFLYDAVESETYSKNRLMN